MKHIDYKFVFKYDENDVLSIIRKEVKWWNVERDISIYLERKTGALLTELGLKYNLTDSAISIINKKVQGAVNKYKGMLFEKKFFQYLKNLYKNYRVEWFGGRGQPDIFVIDSENDTLYVFTLKNLQIKKKSYHITKKKLKAEYLFAYENLFNYTKVYLFLVVFNNVNNKTTKIKLNIKNPASVNL